MGLKYYADVNDAPITDLLIQASIKTENQLMDFSDSSWQKFPDTGRSTEEYIIFYQGGPIEHGMHVPGPVAQSIAEIDYYAECNSWMALEHFRVLIHELLNKDPEIVPEESPMIVLDINSAMCMAKIVNYNKHTGHISRRNNFVRNG